MPSVIIPAHNEARVLARTLASLLADAQPSEFDVVVACNGCTDGTADVARASSPEVRVVETAEAGKAVGLNLGDSAAERFPRIYVDADVVMSTEALRATVATLESGALAAAPRLAIDDSDRSWLVRQYYAIWRRTGYIGDNLIGSGVYGLSEAGRARFDRFPDIIADDLFVYGLFAPGERRTVQGHEFTIQPPRTLRAIRRVKTRVFVGNRQYLARYGRSNHAPSGLQLPAVVRRLPPRLWPALPVYVAVQAAAKLAARRRIRVGDVRSWDRDDTSRDAVPAQR